MEDLLTTVRHVDVHMKRQIIGLEEAGILDLANERTEADAREGEKVSLKPNALGSVGNLDVGWLNSRGEKNERDMEAELWGKGRAVLERAANGTSGDVNMQ
jgi:hypothetical protein